MKQILSFVFCAAVVLAQAPPAPPAPPQPPAPPKAFINLCSRCSYLGIGVQEIDSDRAKELKLPEARGVEVTHVEEGSPAAKCGLKQGDVVLEYNGQRVEGTEQFVRLVRETPPGRQVKLLTGRGGRTETLTPTVGERSGRMAMRNNFNFTMDPKWQQEMQKLQEELGKMRIEMPDMPEPFMSWRSGMLGIEAEAVSSQLAEFFGVKKGVLVRSVSKDSSAEKAGLKAGDVIVRVDGEEVGTPSAVTKRVRELEGKKKFPLTLVRNRQELTLNVTLEDKPADIRPQRIRTPRPQPFRFRAVPVPTLPEASPVL